MGRQQSEKAAQVRLLTVLPRHRGPARAEGEVNADVVAGHRQDRKITDPRCRNMAGRRDHQSVAALVAHRGKISRTIQPVHGVATTVRDRDGMVGSYSGVPGGCGQSTRRTPTTNTADPRRFEGTEMIAAIYARCVRWCF